MDLRIDPEFKNKIPEMPKDAFEGLKADILSDGYVRDPLVVWKEENILLDGHNRWKIIQGNIELLKDKYKIDYKSFPDRYACIAWICANQLHKHNMDDVQKNMLIQAEYEARQKSSGGQVGNKNAEKRGGQNLHLDLSLIDGSEIQIEHRNNKTPKTRQIIAKEHNISEGAVKSAVEFGRGVESGEEVFPGFKQKILSGEVKAPKAKISELRTLEPDVRKEAVQKIVEGRKDDEKKKDMGKIKGYKKQMEFLRQINEDKSDETKSEEFTIKDLVDVIKVNGENYVSSLKNQLTIRSVLLVGENRKLVATEIENIMDKIQKIKELLK